MNRSLFARAFTALLLALIIVSFQNCKGFQPTQSNVETTEQSSIAEVDFNKLLSPNLVRDCFDNPEYNACIFWKNPVAQKGSSFSEEVSSSTRLSSLQIHAVNIEGYDKSGYLTNSTLRVFSYDESTQRQQPLSTKSGDFKFKFENDRAHRLSQVMAFHWLSLQERYMKEVTGDFFASGRAIEVLSYHPDISNAYWSPAENKITIGSTQDGNEFALSAEVFAHEMGHANAHYATRAKIFEEVGSYKSMQCVNTVCCKDANGCSWAIDEGQADYHYAILFPQNTNMLETFQNSTQGLSECGVTRSVDDNDRLTANQAYSSCSDQYSGEVHVMGRVYASAWWEVRKMAERQERGASQEIDTLFTNHLPSLEGRDDFLTALDKIIATDRAIFGGKYGSLFEQEFARRGIFE